jgi:TolA-binding protein
MKLKQLILAAFVGIQFVSPLLAAEGSDTNRDADIETLKQQIQDLSRKVQSLEQQQALDRQTNSEAAQQQIQDLDQKVRILGRQHELDQESAAAAAKAQPRITIGANGFSLGSADSNFVVAIHGLVQVDSRSFKENDKVPGNDSILLRRARPILPRF